MSDFPFDPLTHQRGQWLPCESPPPQLSVEASTCSTVIDLACKLCPDVKQTAGTYNYSLDPKVSTCLQAWWEHEGLVVRRLPMDLPLVKAYLRGVAMT